VRVSGGAHAIRQAFEAGVVDELTIHLAPVLMGRGVRLFEGLSAEALTLEPASAVHSARVTHLACRVVR
jgi:riboflavin biosynthesis pyrimidine reductase